MSRSGRVFLVLSLGLLMGCSPKRALIQTKPPELEGMDGLMVSCAGSDTIHTVLISKAEAILDYENERYEVNVTLFSERDSIIYLSAVSSGFEILRASVKHDSIKVIDRLNKIVYRTPLERRFGYPFPVNFTDLQNLIAEFYLCDALQYGRDDRENHIVFEFDENHIKKRILLNRKGLKLNLFEFYQQQTDRYLMGERVSDAFKIYSNFLIGDIEVLARGGEKTLNRKVKVNMDVNPRKYTFTELR